VSDALKAFPGTIAIPPELLTAQIEAVLTSLINGGFDHLLLVNNHGPNQYPAEVACRNVRRTHGVVVPAVFPAELVRELGGDLLIDNPTAIGHGSEPGTSLLMHLFPDAVRADLLGPGTRRTFNGLDVLSPTDVRFGAGRVKFFLELEEVSDTGRWGDPRSASAELGEALFQRLLTFTSEFVVAFADMNTRVQPPAPRTLDGGSSS
jgi:creatinine amidohydrolase